ncbi:MAG: arginine--tRNA ligase [Gammaproteobacteria bacterium]|nr:arginine--tRNA ligase [Gammaproteobacteria bacterium]
MKTKIQALLRAAVEILQQEKVLPQAALGTIEVENSRQAQHGDYTSNLPLILAKSAGCAPRELAELIIAKLPDSTLLTKVEVAGPGFINFSVALSAKQRVIPEVLAKGEAFGCSQYGNAEKLLLEFVSANPTGPLHVGHGRHAAYGMSLANLLRAVGYSVHCEYYVNDGGRQMQILTVSIWLRYLQKLGESLPFADNGYQGDYIVDIANVIVEQYGDRFQRQAVDVLKGLPADSHDGGDKELYIDGLIQRAKAMLANDYELLAKLSLTPILDDIKEDLTQFCVYFDRWFSEKDLFASGEVEEAINTLESKKLLYQHEGAIWFKSQQFGDEKDRVLIRQNGDKTYFAADVAYHFDKLQRGFSGLIDVLGADHHGYVPRIRSVMKALTGDDKKLRVVLVQFASLYREGKKLQMSTRSGSFITLRQLREEIGNDAAHFFYIMRKERQHVDFDLDLAKSRSNENPVYYIQYAHARICSVFRQLAQKTEMKFEPTRALTVLHRLDNLHEKQLIDKLNTYPELLQQAAVQLEPHLVATWLRDLANHFHSYYNSEQFLVEESDLCQARLSLIQAVGQVIRNGLALLGVSAPEQM